LRRTGAFAGPHCAFPVFIARSGSTIVFNPLTRMSKCGHAKKRLCLAADLHGEKVSLIRTQQFSYRAL
jgi:hypothetical protein